MAEQKRAGKSKDAPKWATPSRIAAQVLIDSTPGPLSSEESKHVKIAARKKIIQLTKKLGRGAAPLKKEVSDYVEALASEKTDARDGLANLEVVFDSSHTGRIKLKNGEGDTEKGKEKIKEIADACVKIAREDLSFLKKTLSTIENGKALSPKDRSELAEILRRNSYFRFIE